MNMILYDAASGLHRSARILKKIANFDETINKATVMSLLVRAEAEIEAAKARISGFRSEGNWY